MDAQQGVKSPGHCKTIRERLRREAEQIASRLAQSETVKALAAEYDCHPNTLVTHMIARIGYKRWRQLVKRRGPQKGAACYHSRQPKEEITTGPQCWGCTMPIAPDTRVCPNCHTLLEG